MSEVCPACGFNPEDPYKHDIDLTGHRVIVRGEWQFLGGYKWDLFYLLWERKGAPVHRDRLIGRVYGSMREEPDSNTLNVYICQLRKMLRGSRFTVENLRGVGYRLVMVSRPGKQLRKKDHAVARLEPLPMAF